MKNLIREIAARIFFFINTLRNAFVLIIITIAAWLYCRHRETKSGKYPIKILETIPPGFQDIGQPKVSKKLLSALGPQLPLATIILLLEHIAIGKCELILRLEQLPTDINFSFRSR